LKIKSEFLMHIGTLEEPDSAPRALSYYTKAVKSYNKVPTVYRKMGDLFAEVGKYREAIDCYKVVNDIDRIKCCFDALIRSDSGNPRLLIEKGDYLLSQGMFQDSMMSYNKASTLTDHDPDSVAVIIQRMEDA